MKTEIDASCAGDVSAPPYYLRGGWKGKVALVGLQATKLVVFACVCTRVW